MFLLKYSQKNLDPVPIDLVRLIIVYKILVSKTLAKYLIAFKKMILIKT